MTYKIKIHANAQADIESLPTSKIRRQINRRIRSLAENPQPRNAELLTGGKLKGLWKLRSGDYRIIYQIRHSVLVVVIIKVGDRQDVYKELARLF